ncbi:hypothetical protein, partial [Klebsiella pneumoniae]|uniref:hypothetical protein n=1 Tax=Klebsiella pneumoniae TaxID=573 RepID=UPI00396A511F
QVSARLASLWKRFENAAPEKLTTMPHLDLDSSFALTDASCQYHSYLLQKQYPASYCQVTERA